MPGKHELDRCFATNSSWANAVAQENPDFFPSLAQGQRPKILWFGCADSRVPESVVLAVKPGEIFVHRNIANQFHLNDDSALSVLTYAIENLGVENIVVAGHTQCGGVKGAYEMACTYGADGSSPLGRWLTPLVEIAREKNLPSFGEVEGVSKLIHESVKRQVENIASTDVIKNAWANGRNVSIHGWIYHLETGKLEDLGVCIDPPAKE